MPTVFLKNALDATTHLARALGTQLLALALDHVDDGVRVPLDQPVDAAGACLHLCHSRRCFIKNAVVNDMGFGCPRRTARSSVRCTCTARLLAKKVVTELHFQNCRSTAAPFVQGFGLPNILSES